MAEPIIPYMPQDENELRLCRQWMNQYLPMDVGPGHALMFVSEGHILAMAYWHNFAAPDVSLSFASIDPRWANKARIKMVLGLPFLTWSAMLRVTSITNKRNRRVRKLLKGVGFSQEGVHPELFGPGTVGISYGMTRAWWEKSHWGPIDGVWKRRELAA